MNRDTLFIRGICNSGVLRMLSKETRAALQEMIKTLCKGLVPSPLYSELLLASAIIELDNAERARLRQRPKRSPGK
jgi:hypothetical protein